MKFALVTETYPPEVNGVAMTLSRLVGGMVGRGHHIDVVRPRQKQELRGRVTVVEADAAKGITQWLVPGIPIPFYQSLRIGLPTWGELLKHWRETRPQLVHVATEGPLGVAALQAARALRLPVTSSFHTNFHQYGGHYGLNIGPGIALRYLRWFHNRTRCTMVPTEEMRQQLAAQGFERLTVISRGVDVGLFSPERRSARLRAEWGVGEGDPVAIYVGRIAAEKNLSLAVEAFLAMQAKEPRAKFVLVGDGPERAALAAKHPSFIYAGMRRGEDLAEHYASADVFIFASTTETFGNVITEAMASGLVVLSYHYAAAREHVKPGMNGFTAAFNDRDAFLKEVDALMQRRGEWSTIREEARACALGITWDAIFANYERMLESALPERSLESSVGV